MKEASGYELQPPWVVAFEVNQTWGITKGWLYVIRFCSIASDITLFTSVHVRFDGVWTKTVDFWWIWDRPANQAPDRCSRKLLEQSSKIISSKGYVANFGNISFYSMVRIHNLAYVNDRGGLWNSHHGQEGFRSNKLSVGLRIAGLWDTDAREVNSY